MWVNLFVDFAQLQTASFSTGARPRRTPPMNEWMNERMNERTNELMNEYLSVCEPIAHKTLHRNTGRPDIYVPDANWTSVIGNINNANVAYYIAASPAFYKSTVPSQVLSVTLTVILVAWFLCWFLRKICLKRRLPSIHQTIRRWTQGNLCGVVCGWFTLPHILSPPSLAVFLYHLANLLNNDSMKLQGEKNNMRDTPPSNYVRVCCSSTRPAMPKMYLESTSIVCIIV